MANHADVHDALIDHYIRLTPGDPPDRAWLAGSGVDVGAIIGHVPGVVPSGTIILLVPPTVVRLGA